MPEPDRPALQRMSVEDRCEQRRLPGAVRPDEPDLLTALDDDRRVVEEPLLAGRQCDVLGLEDNPAASWRVEKVESESPPLLRQRRDLLLRRRAFLLEARDLRELRLSLLRLVLLVAEPLDEALEPGDVDGDAIRCLSGRCGTGCLLLPPLVPRAGEVVGSTGCELEHRGRDRFEEPAVVRDEDHCRIDRLELALEPFEVLHVEVVRRLVEEEQVRAARESARERGTGQLAAGERPERSVEIVVGEAEAANGRGRSVAPCPTACVLESRLRLCVPPQCRCVVRAFRHRFLETT